MKKFFSVMTLIFATFLLTGCATSSVNVSNDEVIKFNGGSVTKTDAYKQLVTTASYDTTHTLIKSMLTQVDMQLLEKNTTYTSNVPDDKVNTQYADMLKQIGEANKVFEMMTSQLGISITNEEEAKKAIRYTMLVEQCVLDKGASDEEIGKAYEQQYGEKVTMKYMVLADQNQASELQKELVSGTVKLEDVVAKFTEFQKAQQEASANQQQQQPQFIYNNKYTIAAVVGENEQSLTKKLGILKAEDEALLFQRSSKDTWLAPMEIQNSQNTSGQAAQKQYIILNPYKYEDASKQLDDTVKTEVKTAVAKSKLQNPSDVEKVMRDYRKANGFEITDPQLKKAFDAYEKSVDTPETAESQNGATTQQTAA